MFSRIDGKYLAIAHVTSIALLIFLFGDKLRSLSADLAHHYAVVDAIMKHGTNMLPHIGFMQLYPSLAHWIAAVVGHMIDSGLIAMWLLSIAAIYGSYCFLFSTLLAGKDLIAAFLFAIALWFVASTHAPIGFEVVDNYLYAQLIGTFGYCAVLYFLATNTWALSLASVIIVSGAATIIMSAHALPAIEVIALFEVFLFGSIIRRFLAHRAIDWRELAGLALFTVFGLALILLHPSFRNLRYLAQNDGSLDIGMNIEFVIGLGVASSIASAYRAFLKPDKDPIQSQIDLAVFSAVAAATALMFLQTVWLKIMHDGSPYAVKKHAFFVFTLSILALSRSISGFVGRPLILDHLRPIMVCALAVAISVSVLRVRPGFDLYEIERQIDSADSIASTSHPKFRPGNTAAFAKTIYPTIDYLISTAAFQLPIGPEASQMLSGKYAPPPSVEYVMVDRDDAVRNGCPQYSETASFSIIPVSCFLKEKK